MMFVCMDVGFGVYKDFVVLDVLKGLVQLFFCVFCVIGWIGVKQGDIQINCLVNQVMGL